MPLTSPFDSIFPALPAPLVKKLERCYSQIKTNFAEGRFEPSELNGAKFCEVVYRILEWHTSGTFTPMGSTIRNFGNSVKKFEGLPTFSNSVRFHIPKILTALYEIRNKRGVGHIGGDVDPNFMDSTLVVASCDWVMAELVRLLHGVSIGEARDIVQNLVVKKIPLIWEVGNVRRVLNPTLSYRDKVLALLYGEYPRQIPESTLYSWVEHSNWSVIRRDVIVPLHKAKLIEYDPSMKTVTISPTGVRYVENNVDLEV